MGQRSAPAPAPAPFLTKTYQLVDDERSNDVVSWNESGTTFVVWKTAEFAKDLLPNYFKHNNFSSFVRQLNTYGFRKIVPDKWEFANESFRKGQNELLCQIRRRKTAPASPAQDPEAGKASDGPSSPSNSGEDMGSTSTSSPEAKSPPSDPTRLTHLSGENENLKRDNQILSSELAQTKKQCEELVAFLTECLKVGPDQIDRVLREGVCRPSITGSVPETTVFDDGEDEEEEERLKLFGVWLKGKKKRGREEEIGCAGPRPKEVKEAAPWTLTNKVCN